MFGAKKRVGLKKLKRNQVITDIVIMGLADTELTKRNITDGDELTDDLLLSAQAINYLLIREVAPEYQDKTQLIEERVNQLIASYRGLDLLVNYILTDRANWYRLVYSDSELKSKDDFLRIARVLQDGKDLYPNEWSDKDFERLFKTFVDKYNPDMSHRVKDIFSV